MSHTETLHAERCAALHAEIVELYAMRRDLIAANDRTFAALVAAQDNLSDFLRERDEARAEVERLRISHDAWMGINEQNLRLIEERNRLRAENAELQAAIKPASPASRRA